MGVQRMDKLLSDTGRWSRKEAKELIRKGQVLVNGKTVRKPEEKADPEQAQVTVCGEVVPWQAKCYLLLHKPAGVLTATEDRRQKTVLELLPQPYRKQGVAPVGRLDKDTTGLLLLTNDGELAHRLLSPKRHVWKTYEAAVTGRLTAADSQAFERGIVLSDFTALPARMEILSAGEDESRARVQVREGKFHQIKRMFGALGHEVTALSRLTFGALSLPEELPPGQYRELTEEELAALRQEAGLAGPEEPEQPEPSEQSERNENA